MKRDQPNPFDAMRASLKAGVTSVSVDQLFETPLEWAEKAARLCRIEEGHSVLEPSAGTGRLIDAVLGLGVDCWIEAVEIDSRLAQHLTNRGDVGSVISGDFLVSARSPTRLGPYDRVLANPPFSNGADILHINAAISLLKPGGRLVAFCANGPRQQAAFMSRAETWEELPAGAFRGTGVRAALFAIDV